MQNVCCSFPRDVWRGIQIAAHNLSRNLPSQTPYYTPFLFPLSPKALNPNVYQVTAGAVLGEVAFCRGGLRTADVVTDTDAEILVLSRERFDELTHERPTLAVELQDLLLGRLADRVADTSAMVRDLLR